MLAARSARRQARATGKALVGRCILGEMPKRHETKAPIRSVLQHKRRIEVESLIRHRHGHYIPDTSGTDDMPIVLGYLYTISASGEEPRGWSRRWMPWFSDPDALKEAERLCQRSRAKMTVVVSAEDAGKNVVLTLSERELLGITTIAPFDVSKKEAQKLAADRKRQRDRERQRQKRQARGVKPRAEYLAKSAEAQKPWEAEGVSRRTWYRRQSIGTSPSQPRIYDPVEATHLCQREKASPKGELGQGSATLAGIQGAEPSGAGEGEVP